MDYRDILIEESTTVLEALRILDKTAKGVLFLIRGKVLVGALSDGDIRRWLLKQGELSSPVSELANYHPISIDETDHGNIREYMMERRVQALPVLNNKREVVNILFLYQDDRPQNHSLREIPVAIMAGGKGTRLYPYTKILPKPLIPIGDIPISEHIVNGFRQYGCNDFWFIVNYKKNMIKAYFNEVEKDYKIQYVDEDKPLGTGGGVSLLKDKITTTFILTNCDTLVKADFSKMLEEHRRKRNLVTMICSLRNFEVPYGVVSIGENGTIESMQEKPSMSFFTNTGTYIVEPEVIDMIKPDEYIDFPTVIQKLKEVGKNVGVYPINEKAWLDMGQFDTMETMKEMLKIED